MPQFPIPRFQTSSFGRVGKPTGKRSAYVDLSSDEDRNNDDDDEDYVEEEEEAAPSKGRWNKRSAGRGRNSRKGYVETALSWST